MTIFRAPSRAQFLFSQVSPKGALARARCFQNKAYDAQFDQEELAEARKWRATFKEESLPKGQTTYSRSSGPGGQHVNKSVVLPQGNQMMTDKRILTSLSGPKARRLRSGL